MPMESSWGPWANRVTGPNTAVDATGLYALYLHKPDSTLQKLLGLTKQEHTANAEMEKL